MDISVVKNWWVVENCEYIRWVNIYFRKVVYRRIRSFEFDGIVKYCEKIGWKDCLVGGKVLRVRDCCKGWRSYISWNFWKWVVIWEKWNFCYVK